MSATNDRTFAEVRQRFAVWLLRAPVAGVFERDGCDQLIERLLCAVAEEVADQLD